LKKFLLIFISIPFISFSQKLEIKKVDNNFIFQSPKTIIFTERNCEKGNKTATLDFNKGIYNYFTYGYSVSFNEKEEKINNEIKNFLKEKYSINYEHKGCVVFEDEECYIKTMIQLIENKFGENFLNKIIEEARGKFILE
jgi:hypothetical protein